MEPTPELTPEEILAVKERWQAAVASFSTDPRHDRYQLCHDNKVAIENYLQEHTLDITAESLHLAYTDLAKEGKLILFDESKIAEPAPTTEAKEKKLPPIGLATGADLGGGLADQQRARRQVEPGVQSSNRNAFINAAQNSPQKVTGGRFHL